MRSSGRAVRSAPAIGDAVDHAGVVVGDQERAVGQLGEVDRPAPGATAGPEPAVDEHLLTGWSALGVEAHAHDAVTDRLAAIPGAVLRDESVVAVFARKHASAVEADPERRGVGIEPEHRVRD